MDRKRKENKPQEEKPVIPFYTTKQGYMQCKKCKNYYNSLKVEACPLCTSRVAQSEYLKKKMNNLKNNPLSPAPQVIVS